MHGLITNSCYGTDSISYAQALFLIDVLQDVEVDVVESPFDVIDPQPGMDECPARSPPLLVLDSLENFAMKLTITFCQQ